MEPILSIFERVLIALSILVLGSESAVNHLVGPQPVTASRSAEGRFDGRVKVRAAKGQRYEAAVLNHIPRTVN
jgi:hypothetical protein